MAVTVPHPNDLGKQICDALGLDITTVSRIIIDIPCDDFVHVYVEMIGTTKLLDVDWDNLADQKVTILDK